MDKRVKATCVDCDTEMVFYAQSMIRCEDCLFRFIMEYPKGDQAKVVSNA